MLTSPEIFWFATAALVLAFTPGPNMLYCLSRSLYQGRWAGLTSLAGVLLAYGVHLLATALGLSAMLLTAPAAFEAFKLAGAVYLLWLAWRMLRPGARAAGYLCSLKPASPKALFCMGFLVNLLNPKAVLFYVALLPQFLQPGRSDVLTQSLQLGAIQVVISGAVMGFLVCSISRFAPLVAGQQRVWQSATRWLMGSIFAALAVRLLMMRAA